MLGFASSALTYDIRPMESIREQLIDAIRIMCKTIEFPDVKARFCSQSQ